MKVKISYGKGINTIEGQAVMCVCVYITVPPVDYIVVCGRGRIPR